MPTKTPYLTVKDHSISGEKFQLLYNEELDMLETFPQPPLEKLPDYYKSENYISHTDGKRNLFEKLYHFVKNISLKKKLKLIDSIDYGGKNLLDFGCGTGDFLQLAKQHNWEISGIEPNDQARQMANEKTDNSVFNVDHLSHYPPESFDVITLWHVLEHLPDLNEQLFNLNNLLKPNGTLIIAVPNYKSYDAHYYKDFWAAYDVPRHLWHFSRNSMAGLVSKLNMEVIQTIPLKYDAFYVSLLSEKYKSGFMNPFKAFWIGWRSNLKARSSNEYSSLIYVIKKVSN